AATTNMSPPATAAPTAPTPSTAAPATTPTMPAARPAASTSISTPSRTIIRLSTTTASWPATPPPATTSPADSRTLSAASRMQMAAAAPTTSTAMRRPTSSTAAGARTCYSATPAMIRWLAAVSDSGLSKATRDVITDFQDGIDKIDLSKIDANTTNGPGDDAFSYLNGNSSTT